MKSNNLSRFIGTLLTSPRMSTRIVRLMMVSFCLVALVAAFKVWPAGMLRAGAAAQTGNRSDDGLWQEFTETAEMRSQARQTRPQSYRTLRLNQAALQRLLQQAPLEFSAAAKQTSVVLTIPLPDGSFARFQIEEAPIMAPELAAQFPAIKTYRGQGVDDPTATARLDWTPDGFHAFVLSGSGSVYVDPYAKGDTANYTSYYKRDYRKDGAAFQCLVSEANQALNGPYPQAPSIVPPNGATFRTYRLALAATVEYTQAAGGTVVQALARMTTTINRVNAIYERDLALRMVLIPNTNTIIYTAEPDPYTNDDGATMLDQNQANLTQVIGNANYDIGHVFSTGGGGIAQLFSPCNPTSKAKGVTGSPNPTGDAFDVDLVSHEIGHQFGARHTFNDGSSSNCTNRDDQAAYEPASGSTIMAYAGICPPQNLQPNSNDYFHVKSLEEMIAHITGAGNCSVTTATGNTPPVANAGTNFTIPRSTPFTLTASATDANGDALTYDWEQYDLGPAAPPNDETGGQLRPIFRSYPPTASGARIFPSLQYILNNANVPPVTYPCGGENCITGEILPALARTMNFQVTVRDNRAGGGGVHSAMMQVTVASQHGPFAVTSPNTAVTWTGNTQQTVTWSVNGTNTAPINAAQVRLLLSTNGGQTFPTVLAASTANDGSEAILVPNGINTTMARLKVEAIGNIFFDISDANFTINAGVNCTYTLNPPSSNNVAGTGANGLSFTVTTNPATGCPFTATTSDGWITLTNASSSPMTFNVAANPNPTPRAGTISVNGQTHTVNQLGNPCTYALNPPSTTNVAAAGANGLLFTVTTAPATGCPFTATTSENWITITNANSSPVTFNIAANLISSARTGTITVAGQTHTVTQNAGAGLMFYPLAAPVRLLDTRPGASANACSQPNAPIAGQTSRIQPGRNLCTIPANAVALTGNVTTVQSGGGFLTLYPSDAVQPTVASTNYGVNEVINNVFTVGLGADGAFKIFANLTTEVVVDVTGYYAPPGTGGLYFHPLPAPVRLLETRAGQPVGCVKPGVPLTGNAESTQQAISACTGIPAAARAIVGNATTVSPQGGGFLTIFPADAVRPLVAASNYNLGQIVNGPFAVGLAANGQFKIYTTSATHLVVDVLGYYSSEANDANGAGLFFNPLPHPVRLLETRPGLPVGCFKPGAPLVGGSETPQTARGVCNGITIPANALGVVGNATVVFPSGPGFLTLWPSTATRPTVATSNYNAGDVGNRHFIVGLGQADGAFKIYAHASSHLVIDLSGYFAP